MSAPVVNIAPSKYPILTKDPTDFGLSIHNADNSFAIQAAHDYLAARGGGVIKIPAGNGIYKTTQSVWLDNGGVYVDGDNGSVIQMNNVREIGVGPYNTYTGASPMFILGRKRAGPNANVLMTPAYRPDLYGVLDSTAAAATGQRWGLRTNFDGYMVAQGTHFSHVGQRYVGGGLDCYQTVNQLTIDIAYQIFTSGGGYIPIMCIGDCTLPNGAPVIFQIDGNNIARINVGTQSAPFANPVNHNVSFPLGTGVGLQKVVFQIDLTVGTFSAWINQVQVTPSISPPFVAGTHFNENQYEPMCVGIFTQGGPTYPGSNFTFDFGLYGMNFSRGLRYYATSGNLTRLDGQTITDGNTYFPNGNLTPKGDANAIGHFVFTENPNGVYTSNINGSGNCRFLSIIADSSTLTEQSSAFIERLGMGQGGINNFGISNITLQNANNYNAILSVSSILQFVLENVTFNGGAYNVASMLTGANYPWYFNKTNFNCAQGESLLAAQTDLHAMYSLFGNSGRTCAKLIGTDSEFYGVVVAAKNPTNECIFKIFGGSYGGQIQLHNINTDYEGTSPNRCVVYCDRSFSAPQTTLLCENFNLNNASYATTIFDLKGSVLTGNLTGSGPLWLMAKNICGLGVNSIARVDGVNVGGEIQDWYFTQAWPSPPIVTTAPSGTPINLRSIDKSRVAPPRYGMYEAGTAVFPVLAPADGHFSEWMTVRRGVVNASGNTPLFAGSKVVASTEFAAAAYIFDHFGGNSVFLSGANTCSWQDAYLGQALTGLFGGAPFTPATTHYFGLVGHITPVRYQTPKEISVGNGYARTAIANNTTNFPPSVSGVKRLVTNVVFPSAVGSWSNGYGNDIQAFGVWNAATNGTNEINFIFDNDQFIDATTGPLVIPSGNGFILSQQPTNLNGFFTNFGWGHLLDSIYGGAGMPVPAAWYLGFSTSGSNLPGVVIEPSGGTNYNRVSVPNGTGFWSNPCTLQDFLGGTLANNLPITIPPATGPWGTLKSLFLSDSSVVGSGNIWLMGDLTQKITINSGQAPTIGTRAIHISLV